MKPGPEVKTQTGKNLKDRIGPGPVGPGLEGSTWTGKTKPGPGPDQTGTRALVHVCLSAWLLVCLSACLLPIKGKHTKKYNSDSRGPFETLTSAICNIFQN